MTLDDVMPHPHYRMCHARIISAPPAAVWDELRRVTMSALPLGYALEGLRLLPARLAGRPAPAAELTDLSRRHTHSSAVVLPATPRGDLGRPEPGLATVGRANTAAPGCRGPARLVATWVDQGRHGVPPRTNFGGHPAEHRDPRCGDGPQDTPGVCGVLVLHPHGQQRDSPRGVESRRRPCGVAAHTARRNDDAHEATPAWVGEISRTSKPCAG